VLTNNKLGGELPQTTQLEWMYHSPEHLGVIYGAILVPRRVTHWAIPVQIGQGRMNYWCSLPELYNCPSEMAS